MNRVQVTPDNMNMTITAPSGQSATLRSARPTGFTVDDVLKARVFPLKDGMQAGQVDRARLFHVFGKPFLLHVNTGPPTWWWPRVEVRRSKVMVGWLRILVAISWEAS